MSSALVPAPRRWSSSGGDRPVTAQETVGISEPALTAARAWLIQLAGIRLTPTDHPAAAGILLRLAAPTAGLPPTVGRRPDDKPADCDAYEIAIGDQIVVSGSHSDGVFRGATTLAQLIASGSTPRGQISDAPRFGWRGISYPVVSDTLGQVDIVLRLIDLLALYKMNVLHLHLTDSEG